MGRKRRKKGKRGPTDRVNERRDEPWTQTIKSEKTMQRNEGGKEGKGRQRQEGKSSRERLAGNEATNILGKRRRQI